MSKIALHYKSEDIRVRLSEQQKNQLQKVASHYRLSEQDLIRQLIKREALRVL